MAGSLTTTHEVIEFEEAKSLRRRRRRRVWLPISIVALMLAALIGIAVHNFEVMRADALTLSRGVIGNLQSRIETEVAAYLGPIPRVVRFTRELLADKALLSVRRELAEKVAVGILNHTPQITSVLIGTTTGEFFMARRTQEGDQPGLEIKTIRRPEGAMGEPVMHLTRRDARGEVVTDGPAPWDGYDPRSRPWYSGAAQRAALFWTDVYPFFTTKAAGITGSVPFFDASGDLVAVVGADVELDNLSRFLATLTIGKTGVAVIVDDAGRVIAHPDQTLVTQGADGEPRLTRIEDIGDAAVNRAFDRYRIEGHGRRDFEMAGRRYISSASSLNHLLQRDWSILVVVPEDDFVGFVAENVKDTLGLGLAVIGLAGLLAGLVVRQGLRTDREAIAILERQAQLDAQGEAFGALAAQSALFENARPEALAPVTEAVARSSQVRRASLWTLAASRDALVCDDCFDQVTQGHTSGAMLQRSVHPGLFELLQSEFRIADAEAAVEERVASLHASYLSPLGCHALLSVPIVVHGQLNGVLWLEDGRRSGWSEQLQRFARAIASLVAIREAAGGVHQAAPETSPSATTAVVRPGSRPRPLDIDSGLDARRSAAFAAQLTGRAAATDGAQVIERLALLTLHLTNPAALAQPASDAAGEATLAHLIAQIETAAAEHGVAYLKFLTDQIVAAADPGEDIQQGAAQLGDFALATQRICERVFAEQHAALAFQIGMDLGPAIGALLGRERRSLNLWGEAPELAGAMAASAPPGTIQVTESVYQALHDHYLFQLRGRHYLAGVGEFSTYLLEGRL